MPDHDDAGDYGGLDVAMCRCCGRPWYECPCPDVFRPGCTRCANHCACKPCSDARNAGGLLSSDARKRRVR
jgi:hypothetical protein